MIGPRSALPEALWREKLAPPRPLVEIPGGLYGPPRSPAGPAWLAWVFDDPEAVVEDAARRATRDGAGRLLLGGPPGNYVVSGVDDAHRPRFCELGFTSIAEHLDLVVDPRVEGGCPGIEAVDDEAALCAWVGSRFGAAWSEECARAGRGGLFVARVGGEVVGFSAAGGNNAALGTFGPVGVIPEARGRGLGAALTRAAMRALAAQGFQEVTVPWVSPQTAAFYQGLATVLRSRRRATLARPLRTGSA
ncbi:MAG: GNAT family N-acetyltransferase [Polyangiales bacterium]